MHLPAADERVPLSELQPVPVVAAQPHGQRILLVEDTDLLREPLERILLELGYDVLSVASAEEALDRLGDGRVDMLVSDVMMPGLSGPQLADELRSRDASLPVLLLSGYTARTVGVLRPDTDYAFLEKPFNLDEFVAKVAETLAGA